ncbi:MAG: tetratricopeptide repeat protein [Deltaproteobacteria bacterium]|nr:tetratricopeptide repeat protein [Deltaproteobacteria bacterium]
MKLARSVCSFASLLTIVVVGNLSLAQNAPASQDRWQQMVDQACSGAQSPDREETCDKVRCDVARLRAQQLVTEADAGRADAREMYARAAEAYLDIWRRHGDQRAQAGQRVVCQHLDEVLYNSGRAYVAAKLPSDAIRIWTLLASPSSGFAQSALTPRAVYEIGGIHQSLGDFDQAADAYERFVRAFPNQQQAPTALADSIVLRLALGQRDKAGADAELHARNYGARPGSSTDEILLALASWDVEHSRWKEAVTGLRAALPTIERHARVDLALRAHTLLGRALVHTGPRKDASAQYASVVVRWRDPGLPQKLVQTFGGSGAELRRLGSVLNAVGEALFFQAEEHRRREVESLAFPAYPFTPRAKGAKVSAQDAARERDSWTLHTSTKVKEWLDKKLAAIELAEREYKRIVEIQPAPPPKWVVAAAARVGWMWGDLYVALTRPRLPPGVVLDAERRAAYLAVISTASAPIGARATAAFEMCVATSVRYQYADRFSESCHAWLSWKDRTRHIPMDELAPRPNLDGNGLVPMRALTEPALP